MNIAILFLISLWFLIGFLISVVDCYLKFAKRKKSNEDFLKLDEESNNCDNYTKEYNQKEVVIHTPAIKKLTNEKIDEIHSRGKITPEEMVKEWESLDLCAPGDGMGGGSSRCRKFVDCHYCLIDYANTQDEWIPVTSILQLVNSINDNYK